MTHEAGPELDKIMYEDFILNPVQADGSRTCLGCIKSPNDWHPSTNIAHAWEVVEKMEAITKHFSLFYCDAHCEWLCRFDSRRCAEEDARVKAWGETAPLAICRAALQTVNL